MDPLHEVLLQISQLLENANQHLESVGEVIQQFTDSTDEPQTSNGWKTTKGWDPPKGWNLGNTKGWKF